MAGTRTKKTSRSYPGPCISVARGNANRQVKRQSLGMSTKVEEDMEHGSYPNFQVSLHNKSQ